jgi:hypothetical protein
VRAVGDQFVAVGFDEFAAVEKKNAGHALHVTGRETDKIALQPGYEHAVDTFAIEVLAKTGASKTERIVQDTVRIGEPGEVV